MRWYFFSSKDPGESGSSKNGFCFDHVTTDMDYGKAPQGLDRLSFWIFPHLAFSFLCPFLECAEELQEPARQSEVKLKNLGWLSSTSALKVGRSEDVAERALGSEADLDSVPHCMTSGKSLKAAKRFLSVMLNPLNIMGSLFLCLPMGPHPASP